LNYNSYSSSFLKVLFFFPLLPTSPALPLGGFFCPSSMTLSICCCSGSLVRLGISSHCFWGLGVSVFGFFPGLFFSTLLLTVLIKISLGETISLQYVFERSSRVLLSYLKV